jgi:hypothetical protein
MLSTLPRRIAARSQVRAFAASPWGGDSWRHDKDAFKAWTTGSVKDPTGLEARQLYGFLGIAFGDVDTNKDGLITAPQFDRLCEKVAALPRRYGMAPSWQVEYANSIEARTAARKTMFNTITGGASSMSLDQWCHFANSHIVAKVATIDYGKCDFNHLEKSNVDQFLKYITVAMEDQNSGAYASFYEFVLTLFIEADVQCKGKINFDQANILMDKAAAVPRFYGLAPEGNCSVTRKEIFDNMSCHEGYVTFDDFLSWTIKHVKAHLKDPTAKATV